MSLSRKSRPLATVICLALHVAAKKQKVMRCADSQSPAACLVVAATSAGGGSSCCWRGTACEPAEASPSPAPEGCPPPSIIGCSMSVALSSCASLQHRVSCLTSFELLVGAAKPVPCCWLGARCAGPQESNGTGQLHNCAAGNLKSAWPTQAACWVRTKLTFEECCSEWVSPQLQSACFDANFTKQRCCQPTPLEPGQAAGPTGLLGWPQWFRHPDAHRQAFAFAMVLPGAQAIGEAVALNRAIRESGSVWPLIAILPGPAMAAVEEPGLAQATSTQRRCDGPAELHAWALTGFDRIALLLSRPRPFKQAPDDLFLFPHTSVGRRHGVDVIVLQPGAAEEARLCNGWARQKDRVDNLVARELGLAAVIEEHEEPLASELPQHQDSNLHCSWPLGLQSSECCHPVISTALGCGAQASPQCCREAWDVGLPDLSEAVQDFERSMSKRAPELSGEVPHFILVNWRRAAVAVLAALISSQIATSILQIAEKLQLALQYYEARDSWDAGALLLRANILEEMNKQPPQGMSWREHTLSHTRYVILAYRNLGLPLRAEAAAARIHQSSWPPWPSAYLFTRALHVGLRNQPVWPIEDLPADSSARQIAEIIAGNAPLLLQDLHNLQQASWTESYSYLVTTPALWTKIMLYDGDLAPAINKLHDGVPYPYRQFHPKLCEIATSTCSLLQGRMAGIRDLRYPYPQPDFEQVNFFRIAAGTKIPWHASTSNMRLAIHMCLAGCDDKSFLQVGPVKLRWRFGQPFIFDDGYDHTVRMDPNLKEDRVILHVMVPHPDIDTTEEFVRAARASIIGLDFAG